MNKNNKLVLIEFLDELKGFLAYIDENKGNLSEFLIVSLQPEVAAYGKRNNINIIDTLAFFNNHSHENVLKKSSELTGLFANKLSFKLESPVKNTFMNTFIYHSRFYINNFTWIIEVMKGIQAVYDNSEIYTFKRQKGLEMGQAGGEPFLLKKDRFIPTIVEKYCTKNRLPFKAITGPQESSAPVKQPKSSLFKIILKKITGKFLTTKLEKLSAGNVIFITAPSYNLDRLCREIKQQIPGVICAAATPLEPSTLGYLKLCAKEMLGFPQKNADNGIILIPIAVFDTAVEDGNEEPPGLKKLKQSYREFIDIYGKAFEYRGCSFLGELNQKVEGDLLVHLYHLHCLAGVQQTILENLDPNLLVSPLSVGLYHSWAEVCGMLNIPALVIPQKGLVAPQNKFARIEEHYIGKVQVTDDFNYAAAQSPLVNAYLKWSGYNGTVIETGNLIFSKIEPHKKKKKAGQFLKTIGSGRKIIVYAPSMKSRKGRRFFVLETLDELIASISDLIDVISQLEHIHLVIRIHPGEPITKQEIEALIFLPPNVSISHQGTFEDVLSITDMVISFSSTSIQEALLNGVPVVLYDRWNRYNHLNAIVFKGTAAEKISAAYYVNDKDALSPCIQWVLEKQEKNEINDESFREYIFPVEKYGNFLDFVKRCMS
ncbi:MAG: hypothetical protein JSV88_21600 [Candidatus Aminicenantes bacterium]|nr:MAG: hypothetical protein JSV88_21600 [Candidatus Aminicenantes bacterium]